MSLFTVTSVLEILYFL